jgi:hypothetical protein
MTGPQRKTFINYTSKSKKVAPFPYIYFIYIDLLQIFFHGLFEKYAILAEMRVFGNFASPQKKAKQCEVDF